jgi:hypothetical protein
MRRDGLGTGRLDRRQPIGKHRGEDVDPIAIISVAELAPGKTQYLMAGTGGAVRATGWRATALPFQQLR